MSSTETAPSNTISLRDTKQLIDSYLQDYATTRRADSLSVGAGYASLWDAISGLIGAGGKRFRPYMTLLSYLAYSDEKETTPILPAAAAVELLHIAMLIHDDIIDRDTTRYGVLNVIGQYESNYQNLLSDQTDRRHFAESAAILAGDVLLSESHAMLYKANVPADRLAKAHGILSNSVFRVVGGELLDTEAAFRPRNEVDALAIATEKTASYSFVGPLLIGAHLAGASANNISALTSLGSNLGIAYQLKDDLLGVFGDPAETGKSNDGDIREGKQTFLVQQFYTLATDEQITRFETTFGKSDADAASIAEVRDLFELSGAKAAIEQRIEQYANEVDATLSSMELPSVYHDAFVDLIDKCLRRTK